METVIEMQHLSKWYKGNAAVNNVSLQIKKGEIYGFIGLNGAGKTTVIRMLLGMIRPTEGACYLHGEPIRKTHHAIWNKIGYIVETPYAYPELTVEENLKIMQKLRLISDSQAVPNVIELVGLTRYTKRKVKHLSLGNMQRLGIAKALLHQPEILILDEPVNGLDPAGIVEMRELLQDLAYNKGVTILISSHLLDEIAKIASKIGIIHKGKLMQEMTTTNLNALLQQRLIINTRDNHAALSEMEASGYSTYINKEGLIELSDKKAILEPDAVAQFLVDIGLPPTKLTVREQSLESYFLSAIKKKEDDRDG